MNDFFETYGAPSKKKAENSADSPNSPTEKDSFDDYVVPDIEKEPENQITFTNSQQNKKSEISVDREFQQEKCSDSEGNINYLLTELENLIGLKQVKYELKSLVQFVRIQELRRQSGISKTEMSLHSVFYGSPGTGKTTVARLYSQILFAMGLLRKGHLIETDRSGLVAKYVGQTAVKTDEKIKEALGGILFIDEAYSLSKGENVEWDYGSEAIEILVKRMEDYRDEFVVIVAGYPEPMGKFLNSNEGLRSRFSTYIYFQDYTPSEMLEIFKLFCERENYLIGEEALNLALASIQYNYTNRDSSFGNARFVRNLFEAIIRNQAIRIGSTKQNPTVDDLQQIKPEDVPLIIATNVQPYDFKGNR